jgi:hypothetical protein
MKIIDREKLLDHVDGDMDLLKDTFEILLVERPEMLKKLRTVFESGDVEAVQLQAHRCKGMLSNFMAEVACATALKIERLDSPAAIADSFPLLDQLARQMEEIEIELDQLIQKSR